MVDKRGMAREPGTDAGQETVGNDQVIVGPNRRGALAWGLFFGILVASSAVRAITAHKVSALVIELLVLGTPCVFYLQRAFKGRALIVIDDRGFTDCRSGRTVEWGEIETVRANTPSASYSSRARTASPPSADSLQPTRARKTRSK